MTVSGQLGVYGWKLTSNGVSLVAFSPAVRYLVTNLFKY